MSFLYVRSHVFYKDWPPAQDFQMSFPELYEDFAEAVPVPNYVRRDGALNIASHFPQNTIAPDLGDCSVLFLDPGLPC
jgi:hypothetical protein